MNPVCYGCRVEMVCLQNGVEVSPSPHTFIRGDAYCCPACGARVIVAFAVKASTTPQGDDVIELKEKRPWG